MWKDIWHVTTILVRLNLLKRPFHSKGWMQAARCSWWFVILMVFLVVHTSRMYIPVSNPSSNMLQERAQLGASSGKQAMQQRAVLIRLLLQWNKNLRMFCLVCDKNILEGIKKARVLLCEGDCRQLSIAIALGSLFPRLRYLLPFRSVFLPRLFTESERH